MQLSSWCDDCWSCHILSAMNGLTQSYLLKERLLKCEPMDLGRFVMDLFWLAKTSNKPISLTTCLAVNPLTCNLQLVDLRERHLE